MKNYRLKTGDVQKNQADQLAILKALENIKYMETDERTVIDSRITLESLKTRKNHTYVIKKSGRK